MQSPVRFSSCRGVAFEAKAHTDHFAIEMPGKTLPFWARLGSSSRIFPASIDRSASRASSHFCDLLEDEDDENKAEDSMEDLEKQISKHKVNVAEQKPARSSSRLSIILLDQGVFTVYKRLFALSLALNTTALVLAATGKFPYGKERPSLFSIGNIFALTLCRSEAFMRLVFFLAVTLLGRPSVPISVKTAVTSLLQSVGGIHSGCGVSSIAWLAYAVFLSLNQTPKAHTEIVAVSSTILGLLVLSSAMAFPLVRHLHHNAFEATHRFAAWAALILLWSFLVLTIGHEPRLLLRSQEFWLTLATTALTVLPWATVRRVPVRAEAPPGNHAAILRFSGGGVRAGILGRISQSPLLEWHAFGIVSDGEAGHMMVAGAVGDFTRKLVAEPPSYVWVRGVHFAGLPYLANMYSRVVLVATGSGICVFLSFLLQRSSAEVCLVWVAKGIEANFGREIREMVSGFPKERVRVHDTAVSGRPDVAEMAVDAAMTWRAEVVIVTSNPKGSRDVVAACNLAGIPAFGPIWDS